MASNPKRAHLDNVPDTPDQTESSSENDSASDDESNDLEREIQVEFEARTPEERDLPGVISLLKQCFRGSEDVNLGALAQYVLKQRSVGSVVTQSPSDSTDDEDEDELGGTDGEVFGLATIIRLKGSEVSDMIVRHMSKSVASTDRRGQLSNLLTALDSDVGLIISERIINMPPQIAVPLIKLWPMRLKRLKPRTYPSISLIMPLFRKF